MLLYCACAGAIRYRYNIRESFFYVKDLSELCYNITMNGGEQNLHYVMNQNKQVRTAVLESEKGYTVFYTFESKIKDLFDLKNEIVFMHSRRAMA